MGLKNNKERDKITKKIMVVDDDSDVIYSIKTGLINLSKNYEVMGVNSGRECFECLENGVKPDLILLDIMLPGMDGWRIYDFLKESDNWNDIPVVFLTGRDDEKTMKKGMETDAYCIRKPFDMKRLKEVLDEVLGLNSLF